MILERINKDKTQIDVGDIVITESGAKLLIKNDGEYCLISFNGTRTTGWYSTIGRLKEVISIKDVIKNENVKLVEIEGGK